MLYSTDMRLSCFLQDRQAYGSSPEPASPTHDEDDEAAGLKNHMDTDNLQAFFSGLMNRGKTRAETRL